MQNELINGQIKRNFLFVFHLFFHSIQKPYIKFIHIRWMQLSKRFSYLNIPSTRSRSRQIEVKCIGDHLKDRRRRSFFLLTHNAKNWFDYKFIVPFSENKWIEKCAIWMRLRENVNLEVVSPLCQKWWKPVYLLRSIYKNVRKSREKKTYIFSDKYVQ